jgi:hypothetical protein
MTVNGVPSTIMIEGMASFDKSWYFAQTKHAKDSWQRMKESHTLYREFRLAIAATELNWRFKKN